MPEKLAPSTQLRNELHAFLQRMDVAAPNDGPGAVSALVRRAATLLIQESLEAEQRDFLGRERYGRQAAAGGAAAGYRNGYEPGHVDTAEGRVAVQRPQVRGGERPFHSALYAFLRGHSDVVARRATEMYVRGLSTRDVEAAFTDADGTCLLSRTAVSEVTETVWEEYAAFQQRDLSGLPVLYVFLDGVYEPLRVHGIGREALLVAWAVTLTGEKVLLSLALGNRESHEAWREFLRDLTARGLPTPLTITTDGAPALLRAVAECWPRSLRLRCWVHKMRNVEAKVPAARWPEVKAHLYAIRDAATRATAEVAVQDFLARYGRELPSACACLGEDLEAQLAHLALPWRHRQFVRSTNLCERSFVEERRRSKTIPRCFTEKSCLKLVYATLVRAAAGWHKVPISALERGQLQLLYQQQGLAPSGQVGTAA